MTAGNVSLPSDTNRPTQVRWLIFVLACATSWLLYLHRYSWGVIKPFLQKEHPELDEVALGWLDGLFMASYGIGQVPGGLAGDVLGPRSILSVLILLWSGTVALLGWSYLFWPLAAIRSAFGLTQAPAYPILSKITRSWFPLAIRTSVQGAVTASGRIGGACAPFVIAWLLMGRLGLTWNSALVVLAGLGALLSVAFWLAVRDNPREHPWANDAERGLVTGTEPAPIAGTRPVLRWDARNRFNLSMFLLTAFASTFADNLYVNLIPSFLTQEKRFTKEEMGVFTPLPLLGGAVGGVVGGVLSDYVIRRSGNRRWARSGVGFAGKLTAAVLMVISLKFEDGRLVVIVLLVSKFFTDWTVPLVWGTVTDISGRAAGTVFGVVNMVGAAAGFLAGPAMGYVKKMYGWDVLFLSVAGVYVVAAGAWLFIDCTQRLVVEPRPDRVS
jgi:sugar phosphate permease